MSVSTLGELFLGSLTRPKPDHLARCVDGDVREIPTAAFARDVYRLAAALGGELGVRAGDRLALWAGNSPRWTTIDFAALALGAVVVPLDPALPEGDAVARLRASAARVVFVEGRERLAAVLARRGELPAVDRLVTVDDAEHDEATELRALIERGAGADPAAIEEAARARRPDEPATLVYAEETTGEPRAVRLTHGQIAAAVAAAARVLPIGEHHVALVRHPLANVFERTLHYLYLHRGATVVYPQSPATTLRDLRVVRPHVTSATFADCKRLMNAIYDRVQRQSSWRRRLFRWAVATGRRALPDRLAGRAPSGLLRLRSWFADRRVFEPLRGLTGGRLELVITAGSPLTPGWLSFLWAAGFPIYERYGLAETGGLAALNAPGAVKLETAGRPLPGIDVRIADGGEILLRGAAVARGTSNGDSAGDGWLATGDLGALDAEGFLTVTGRRANRVEAGDERFSPEPVERLLASSHFLRHAVVFVRDGRPAALLFPDFARLRAAAGLGDADPRALVADPRVREMVAAEIEGIVGALPEPRRPRSWELLPDELRRDRGELTVDGAVRRDAVIDRYRSLVE